MPSEQRKLAIVTGGGSGLGLAIARKLAEENIKTIIIGRDAAKLEIASREIGENCDARTFDLSRLSEIPSLVEEITKKYGHIDILVNNAGINMKKDLLDVTDEDFQKIMDTNVNAVFAISREVARQMIKQGNGSIINVSSMAAQYGMPKVIAYTASKTAIEGMTRAMAVELSPKGIRVNAVAPGFIVTAMTSAALNSDPERKARVMSRTPMGFMGEPADIANAVHFLCSDAAKYITGVILPVDGGNSVGF